MDTIKGITVKELKELCDELISGGFGNKQVMVSKDDEGNGYHVLYETVVTDRDTLYKLKAYGLFDNWNSNIDPDDVIILG